MDFLNSLVNSKNEMKRLYSCASSKIVDPKKIMDKKVLNSILNDCNVVLQNGTKKEVLTHRKNVVSARFFYLFMNIVYFEKIKKKYRIKMSEYEEGEFFQKLYQKISSECVEPDMELGKCIADHKYGIDVIPMELFEKEVQKSCGKEIKSVEQCIRKINIPVLIGK